MTNPIAALGLPAGLPEMTGMGVYQGPVGGFNQSEWDNLNRVAQDYAKASLAPVSDYYRKPREMTAADLGLYLTPIVLGCPQLKPPHALTADEFYAQFPDDFPEEGSNIIDRLDERMDGRSHGDELGDLLWDAANIIEWVVARLNWSPAPTATADAPYSFWLGAPDD